MKTLTKLTVAAVLAVAAAAPAFAQTHHAMNNNHATAQTQKASDAYAAEPATTDSYDPAANAAQY